MTAAAHLGRAMRGAVARLAAVAAIAVGVAAALAAPGAARAGQACEAKPLAPAALVAGLELAEHTRRALDASGAQVVVLARVGRDLGRYRLEWSHVGFAYRDGERWLVAHKLNDCGSDASDLWRQGLGTFFLDDLFAYRAGFAVPAADVQRRLRALIADDAALARMHEPRYNLVSHPWSTRYQQSNQWAIETLALAMQPTLADRAAAQRWLRATGYAPSALSIGAAERLGGQVSSVAIRFDDHPLDQRLAGRIETATADSVFAWLERSALAGPVQVVQAPPAR